MPPPESLFAGAHRINGNGELTGLEWIRDSGLLTTPIALTNTHSVGVVRDALVAAAHARSAATAGACPSSARPGTASSTTSTASTSSRSTWRGARRRARRAGRRRARSAAAPGWSATASRAASARPRGRSQRAAGSSACSCRRTTAAATRLRVNGVPVGERIGAERVPAARDGRRHRLDHRPDRDRRAAPPGPVRAARAAGRVRDRAHGRHGRALERRLRALLRDREPRPRGGRGASSALRMLNDARIDPLYEATIDAVEESILNALLAAETMTGRDAATRCTRSRTSSCSRRSAAEDLLGVARHERRRSARPRRSAPRAVPISATRPWSSTTIWSASRTVESRCAIAIVVRPSASRSSASCTARSVCVSSAEVASSRTRIGGLRRIVRAIAIRCRSPPEKR